MSPRPFADRFPYLEECVYLNTAAAGVSWSGQGRAAAEFYDGAKARGFNGMALWREPAARVRASIARLLQVRDQEVRFAASTTEALNLVAGAIRWRRGDEIVVAADEFPSVVAACQRAESMGATVRRIEIASETTREASLLDAITPATRMLAASHVHWATGTRLDLRRLSAACKEVGGFTLIDGVQALGAARVELGETDAYCASVFKWLLSGFGLAIVVVRDRAREQQLTPSVRGYNNLAPSTELQHSHINYPGLFALAASLDFLESIVGWSNVFGTVDTLTGRLIAELTNRGLEVVTPAAARAGIVSCRVPDSDRLRDTLATRGIFVESREGLLRVSPHFYNTAGDLLGLSEALAVI
jgi:cysteine desulfurase / selenocysteine lyase